MARGNFTQRLYIDRRFACIAITTPTAMHWSVYECSKTVCPECKVAFDGKIYCNSCIQKKVAGASLAKPASPAAAQPGNTSGMGRSAVVPPGLGEFNWGASF